MKKRKSLVVSVVIPAYDEEGYIGPCLDALNGQRHGPPHEIIVCDNGSTDHTAQIVLRAGVRLVSESVKGYSRAVATGIGRTRGNIVALIDADTRVGPDWLSTVAQLFEENPSLVCVGGPSEFYDAAAWQRRAWHFLNTISMMLGVIQPMGFNMAFRKRTYETVGGVSTQSDLQWDRLLVVRLRAKGHVWFRKDLTVAISSRRYRSSCVIAWEIVQRGLNTLTIALVGKPIFRRFTDYR